MHPALILAEINIIFPVFADYIDSQLEKYTTSFATGFGTSVDRHLTSYKKKYQRNHGVSRTC